MSDLRRKQHEPEITRRYWDKRGTLLLEYLVVRGRRGDGESPGTGSRRMDAIIVRRGKSEVIPYADEKRFSLKGRDVIVVQTKRTRLSMPLLGQALFSRALVKKYCKPRSAISVALCAEDDAVLRPIAERYGIKIEVDKVAANRRKATKARKQQPRRRS